MGLQADANITGAQFSLLATIFYVSYLGFEFPHAYVMQMLPTAKYLGVMVALVSQPSRFNLRDTYSSSSKVFAHLNAVLCRYRRA